jgi:hypothetical protein
MCSSIPCPHDTAEYSRWARSGRTAGAFLNFKQGRAGQEEDPNKRKFAKPDLACPWKLLMSLELECGVGLHLLRHVTPLKRRDLFLLRRSYPEEDLSPGGWQKWRYRKGRRSTHNRHQALTAIQQIAGQSQANRKQPCGRVTCLLLNLFHKNTLKNTSKLACQAPNPLNPFPINNIHLAYKLHSTRYTGYRAKKSPPKFGRELNLARNPFVMTNFIHNPFVMTNLRQATPRKSLIQNRKATRYIGEGGTPQEAKEK